MYGLDEIVEFRADVASVHNGSETLESISLNFQLVDAVLYHLNKRLDLIVGEVLIDRIVSNELRNTLEQRIGEVRVCSLSLLEEFENSVKELLEELAERRQAKANNLCDDCK